MIGIVLWSDASAGKAVIWCEDQGDLAFYSQSRSCGELDLCPGNWVSFQVTLKADMRQARNLKTLAEPGCPDLVADLIAAGQRGRSAGKLRTVQPAGPAPDKSAARKSAPRPLGWSVVFNRSSEGRSIPVSSGQGSGKPVRFALPPVAWSGKGGDTTVVLFPYGDNGCCRSA